jgi:UDP-galactopyranose mutase
LPASILKRLPMRFDYNDNYYESAFQGIPEEGYTAMVEQILRHDRIRVVLNQKFDQNGPRGDHLFYTGPLDAYFEYKLGRLGYRTVLFERVDAIGDLQGNAVMNYPGLEVEFTRIHEHKHFTPWERHDRTVAFREFSKETTQSDVPFYPKRLTPDLTLLGQYQQLAERETGVSFLGRLGTYRYLDMDQVIGEALDFATAFLRAIEKKISPPVFSGRAS